MVVTSLSLQVLLVITVLAKDQETVDYLGLKSILSYNYPSHGVGMKHAEVYIVKNMFHGFRIVKGLNNQPGAISFKSLNHSNHYLCNKSSFMFIEKNNQMQNFQNCSSYFIRIDRFYHKSVAFESSSYPEYFIRHDNYRVKLERSDGTTKFKQDASYKIQPIITFIAGSDGDKKTYSRTWLAAPIVFPMFLILFLLGRRNQGSDCFSRFCHKCNRRESNKETAENYEEYEVTASPEQGKAKFSSLSSEPPPLYQMATSYVNETVTDDAPVAYVLLDRNRAIYALSDTNKDDHTPTHLLANMSNSKIDYPILNTCEAVGETVTMSNSEDASSTKDLQSTA
ncbi:uncharacterized protein LOC130630534 isoform X2 [Hydractinia symbiolongicarpus]|uniref:uncharacterized protein LOC130630534 isoform X2 n=1 Tax=Hydractinia symbiolongicarpus TaxID=13093 RepID=UPI002549F9CD|nr:uncharacterized protein LOC130630534 isoform X2 [Hydractinia symbiolongicarpus]